jgi:hypothetical protein
VSELKPEDVMMAFEICLYSDSCERCPYNDVIECHRQRMKDALARIREMNEEIKRLKAKSQLDDAAYEGMQELYDADVKDLSDTLADALVRAEIAKFEAITEFLERAKSKAREMGDLKPFITIEDLERIAKELKGE